MPTPHARHRARCSPASPMALTRSTFARPTAITPRTCRPSRSRSTRLRPHVVITTPPPDPTNVTSGTIPFSAGDAVTVMSRSTVPPRRRARARRRTVRWPTARTRSPCRARRGRQYRQRVDDVEGADDAAGVVARQQAQPERQSLVVHVHVHDERCDIRDVLGRQRHGRARARRASPPAPSPTARTASCSRARTPPATPRRRAGRGQSTPCRPCSAASREARARRRLAPRASVSRSPAAPRRAQ